MFPSVFPLVPALVSSPPCPSWLSLAPGSAPAGPAASAASPGPRGALLPTSRGVGFARLPRRLGPAQPTVSGRAALAVGFAGFAGFAGTGRAAARGPGSPASVPEAPGRAHGRRPSRSPSPAWASSGPAPAAGASRLSRPAAPRPLDHPDITRVPPTFGGPRSPWGRPDLVRHRPWRAIRGVEPAARRPARRERGSAPPRGRRGLPIGPRPPLGRRSPRHPVSASAGAELLGVSPARFSRLARGGCFSPCEFLLTEHGVIAWRYPPVELLLLARRRPGLLAGSLPEGLRHTLRQGRDWRPRRWRARRTGLLAGQAPGPWEAAAVPAAVLPLGTLRAEVPDAAERAVLGRLRPPLVAARLAAGPWRTVRRLLTVHDADETGWYREQLAAALRLARRRPLPALTAGPRPSP